MNAMNSMFTQITPLVALAGGLGLLVGSFLNVLIHRLPKMLERQWAAEAKAAQGQDPTEAEQAPYNLMVPRSACPHCGHRIRWYENIPVLSFLALRGRCAACGVGIAWRYPLVELTTALLFAGCAARWGITPTAGAWALFCAVVLALAAIDWDTTLLPDDLTLPLVWAGLCASSLGWSGLSLSTSLWGAVAGYMSLWSVYWLFKLLTGKEGMGYGDFKLFAALGAWLGWSALPAVILMASIIGSVVGIAMKLNAQLREGGYVPFGPFLALGGLTAWWLGSDRMLGWIGL
jgi:leader peptidase (prepilin peptidase)/N-methyltransferase